MRIITRYFTREFIKIFFQCMTTFVALYLFVDVFDRIDNIINHRVPVSLVFQYCACLVPFIIYQVCPLGVLLCTFITIGIFVRHNEITVLKAHGISLYTVLKVFLLISVCLCLFSVWLQEYILPFTNVRAREIKTNYIKGKKRARLLKSPHFWYRSRDNVYNVEFFDPENNILQNITILFFEKSTFLSKRIDAEKAEWKEGRWLFSRGIDRVFKPDGQVEAEKFKTRVISMDKSPEDFKMIAKRGSDMGFSEIKGFIKSIKKQGYSSTAYEVDMHSKLSYPFINIIMALLGIPFALRIGRSGGMALGIAISIALGFFYWMFFAFCLSLGNGGILPPVVAAWVANISFGFLGLYMFLHVRQ